MKLIEWLQKTDRDIDSAAQDFGVSIFAIRKWLRGERIPRPQTQVKIKRITKGLVTSEDWMPVSE